MKQPILLTIVICFILCSCKKQYVDEISKNIEVSVRDSAFRVDSVAVINMSIGENSITFDVCIYGNPLDKISIELLIGDRQMGYQLSGNTYKIDELIPNHPYLLTVNIRPDSEWEKVVATAEAPFVTGNNVDNTNFLYDHRSYFVPMDHVATSDGGFVFLSWGNTRHWRNDASQNPVFEYKGKANLNFFKTDTQGKILWHGEIPDVNVNNSYIKDAVMKVFDNGDLLVVAGCDVYRFAADGERRWMYTIDNPMEATILYDADIKSDGSIIAVGSSYNGTVLKGRLLHIDGDGTPIGNQNYDDEILGITSFFGVSSTTNGDVFVLGRPADDGDVGMIKIVGGKTAWTKRIVYEGYKDYWNTNLGIERTVDDQIFISAYLQGIQASYSLVAKLDKEGIILNGKAIDYLHLKDATMDVDGAVYVTGANNYGMFLGYNRMVVLDNGFNLTEDLSFQGGLGTSEGYSLATVPNGGISIFGLSGGLQWHSLF